MAKGSSNSNAQSKPSDRRWVKPDDRTGKFVEVGPTGRSATSKVKKILKDAAERDSAALIRLADR